MRNTKYKYHQYSFLVVSILFSLFSKASSFNSIEATGDSIHKQATREALSSLLSEPNLKFLIESNEAQEKPGSEAATELRRHFGDAHFSSSLGYIDREKKRALNYAAESDTDAESRGHALQHIGEFIHSTQDFYLRTNYIELMLTQDQYKNDPYSIPLVDWQKIPDAYPGLECSQPNQSSAPNKTPSYTKDSPFSESGKKTINTRTNYFQIARELATRETQRQWNLFETLLRNRCGTRATSVIAALRQASPEIKAGDNN